MEEQRHMLTIISKEEKNRRDKERKKKNRRNENGELKSRVGVIERRKLVAELIELGYTQKQIADTLGISVDTVKNDRKYINKY